MKLQNISSFVPQKQIDSYVSRHGRLFRNGDRISMRIKMVVAYDGTNYKGWQVQPNGITIEEVLNKNLSNLLAGLRSAPYR